MLHLDKQTQCSREIGNLEIIKGITFQQAVLKYTPKELKSQILSWAANTGPFWSDDREENDDDYFEHAEIDVTDQGLGECARRIIKAKDVSSFSFDGDYSSATLEVTHGLPEEPIGSYNVDNISSIKTLIESAESSQPRPTCWDEAIDSLKDQFPSLMISDDTYKQIAPIPFSLSLYERLYDRFLVLEQYLDSRDCFGVNTNKTNTILKDYFQGESAPFSDESDSNIKDFKSKLTFKNLVTGKDELFSYHGKINSTPKIRIHFNWPPSPKDKHIQIVYIGQKITKS